jgi:hypothetical protein
MKQLIRDQDIQIVELKKELEVLNSCCSCKNVPVTEDTSIDQDDSVSSGQAGRSLGFLSNKPNLGSYDASVDNFHVSKRYFNTQNLVYLSLHLSPWFFFLENMDGNTCQLCLLQSLELTLKGSLSTLKGSLSLFWNLEGYHHFMFFLPLFPFFSVFYFSLSTVYIQLLASK